MSLRLALEELEADEELLVTLTLTDRELDFVADMDPEAEEEL